MISIGISASANRLGLSVFFGFRMSKRFRESSTSAHGKPLSASDLLLTDDFSFFAGPDEKAVSPAVCPYGTHDGFNSLIRFQNRSVNNLNLVIQSGHLFTLREPLLRTTVFDFQWPHTYSFSRFFRKTSEKCFFGAVFPEGADPRITGASRSLQPPLTTFHGFVTDLRSLSFSLPFLLFSLLLLPSLRG